VGCQKTTRRLVGERSVVRIVPPSQRVGGEEWVGACLEAAASGPDREGCGSRCDASQHAMVGAMRWSVAMACQGSDAGSQANVAYPRLA